MTRDLEIKSQVQTRDLALIMGWIGDMRMLLTRGCSRSRNWLAEETDSQLLVARKADVSIANWASTLFPLHSQPDRVCIVRRTRVEERTARRRAAGREEEEGVGEVIKGVGVGKLWTWTSGAHEGSNRRCIRALSLAGADRGATGAACSRGELFHAFFARFILFSCPSAIESTIHRLLANCGAENGSII
jgi:hypothetical protein